MINSSVVLLLFRIFLTVYFMAKNLKKIMLDAALQHQQSSEKDDNSTLVFNLKLPVPTSSATVLSQALDFGKPMKDTTRRFSICAAAADDAFNNNNNTNNSATSSTTALSSSSSSGGRQVVQDYFNNNNNNTNNTISLVDITITSTNAKSLRIAVFGLMENLNLSLRTLEMFAHHQPNTCTSSENEQQQNNNNNNLNPLSSSNTSNNNNQMTMMSRSGTSNNSGDHQHQQSSSSGGIKKSPVVGPVQPTNFGSSESFSL